MVETLLLTKYITPPLRPNVVPRQRLSQKLRQAVEISLTLVSAPPGFGKTTAVLAATHALQAEVDAALTWLSLDEDDNEPARFWRYIVAALQTAAAGVGEDLTASLETPQPLAIQPLLTRLLNDLAGREGHYLLVLDDYHVISQTEIHQALAFLLEHAPPNLHLLLVTRADPPLPLHRLRARGQLIEIRAEDLRFDPAESATFLASVMGLSLTDDEVSCLTERTEGWVAGLQLAALALQAVPTSQLPVRRDFLARLTRNNRYVLDYLAEEVLAKQPEHVQAFLLQTSILSALCGSLCDAVLHGHGGQAMLETLAQRNLFLAPICAPDAASDEPAWFRYHPLFADLLQGHLRQHQASVVPVLHSRAAVWYEARGDVEAAIEHALIGQDYACAVRLLDGHAARMAMNGRVLTLECWLGRLPDGWRHTLPRADVAFAWVLLLRGRYREIEPYLQQAEAAIGSDDQALRGELLALRAVLADAEGRGAEALSYAQQALDSVPADNRFAQAMAQFAMASALRSTGEAEAAIVAYERAIPLCRVARLVLPEMLSRAHLGFLCTLLGRLRQAEAITRPAVVPPVYYPAASAAQAALAAVLLEWNQLQEAEDQLQQALAQQSGHNTVRVRIQLLLARLRRAQGDWTQAAAALDAAAISMAEGASAWVEPLLIAEHVQLWLDQGALGTAEQFLRERGVAVDAAEGLGRGVLPLVRARLRYLQGRQAEARTILDDVLPMLEAGSRQGQVIAGLVQRALVHDAEDDESAARRDVLRALALAEPERYVRIFLDAGAPMASLLARVESGYARRLLDAFPSAVRDTFASAAGLLDSLTERERDVLGGMARGLTYQQIADELVISVNTVRHHVKGIYGKLQVDTRTRALEKARALNLL